MPSKNDDVTLASIWIPKWKVVSTHVMNTAFYYVSG